MSQPFTLTVYGTPAAAGSKRAFPLGGKPGGRPIIVDANKKAAPWKNIIAQHAGIAMAGREAFRGPIQAVFCFYVRRPKGHTGKRGLLPSAPAFPAVKPDVLKLARAVEDALSGIVYHDDALIVREVLEKHYGEQERVEIVISEVAQ